MSLYNFFFPQQAAADHLQELAKSQKEKSREESHHSKHQDERLEELEMDLGYVSLILGALLQKVDEKGVLSRAEVRETMSALDEIDGVKDGKLDINLLRGLNA